MRENGDHLYGQGPGGSNITLHKSKMEANVKFRTTTRVCQRLSRFTDPSSGCGGLPVPGSGSQGGPLTPGLLA